MVKQISEWLAWPDRPVDGSDSEILRIHVDFCLLLVLETPFLFYGRSRTILISFFFSSLPILLRFPSSLSLSSSLFLFSSLRNWNTHVCLRFFCFIHNIPNGYSLLNTPPTSPEHPRWFPNKCPSTSSNLAADSGPSGTCSVLHRPPQLPLHDAEYLS